MAINYFDVELGFSIDEGSIIIFKGTSNTTDLSGVLSADVPVGSIFLNTVTGELLTRALAVDDDVNDWEVSSSKDYVDSQIATQISWREPVVVRDNTTYANIAAAETAMNASSPPGLDGVTLNDLDRILITDLTSGQENVYIVTGTPGPGSPAATLVEDVNTATNGDTVYVQSGTDAGDRYTYNGTTWVLTDSSSADELSYIRDFIGKDSTGPETPAYTNNYNITASNDLEGAIDELDTILGTNTFTNDFVVTDSVSYTANIDALDTQFGDGNITNIAGNYALSSDMLWGAGSPAGTLTITDAFNAVNNVIGDRVYTADNYVTDGESITASIDALDIAIGGVAILQFTGNNVAAAALAVDSTLAHGGNPSEVKWFLLVRDTATPANIEALEIHALTDGLTLSDITVYAKLKTGAKVAGLSVDAAINGANYELQVTASNNIDYVVERAHTLSF